MISLLSNHPISFLDLPGAVLMPPPSNPFPGEGPHYLALTCLTFSPSFSPPLWGCHFCSYHAGLIVKGPQAALGRLLLCDPQQRNFPFTLHPPPSVNQGKLAACSQGRLESLSSPDHPGIDTPWQSPWLSPATSVRLWRSDSIRLSQVCSLLFC